MLINFLSIILIISCCVVARMTGQLLDPQKFPLMPPQMRLAFFDAMSRRVNGVGGYRLPVPPMGGIPLPPFGPMIQTSRMRFFYGFMIRDCF